MKIVVDTNVFISGVFFGGAPKRVIQAVQRQLVEAAATPEIMHEYSDIISEMVERGQGHFDVTGANHFLSSLDVTLPKTKVQVCRDPDDDKFIGCAIDAHAIYIVSGDKDLLTIGAYEGVEMVTAAEFCRRYL